MKKKEARKLVPGDKLVMVCAGSYSAGFEAGDAVSFVGLGEDPRLSVSGLYEGREITQTISRKDVELYTEPKETPAQPERPHEALRATYKAGQEWEFKQIGETCAFMSMRGNEPCWFASFEYRLKPEPPKQTRREQLIAAGVPAEELEKVAGGLLDRDAKPGATGTLIGAFTWGDTAQGHNYWEAWCSRLGGKDVIIPEPLGAAPELYCVVFGDDNRMCAISHCADFKGGTLKECKKTAAMMTRNFPSGNYRVMRLTPA